VSVGCCKELYYHLCVFVESPRRIFRDCDGVFGVFFGDVESSVLGTLVRDFAVEKKTAINANEVGE
jgi:hypothetical protein